MTAKENRDEIDARPDMHKLAMQMLTRGDWNRINLALTNSSGTEGPYAETQRKVEEIIRKNGVFFTPNEQSCMQKICEAAMALRDVGGLNRVGDDGEHQVEQIELSMAVEELRGLRKSRRG